MNELVGELSQWQILSIEKYVDVISNKIRSDLYVLRSFTQSVEPRVCLMAYHSRLSSESRVLISLYRVYQKLSRQTKPGDTSHHFKTI